MGQRQAAFLVGAPDLEREKGHRKSVKYKIVVEGLKLPTLNRVLRMYWRERHAEMKRTRRAVEEAARYSFGLVDPTPLSKAQVSIVAYGPYQRRDSDGTVHKWVLDSLVAKPIRVAGMTVGRSWGLIENDSPDVVGDVEMKTKIADDYRVEIEVYEV